MAADRREEPADEAVWRPAREADAAAGARHAHELGSGAGVVGGEHRAKGRERHVERGGCKGQVLGIGDADGHREALGGGAGAGTFEQGRDVVGGGDLGETPRRRERRVAVAGGDVEYPLPGAEVDRLAERFSDDLQRGAHDGIVAGGPGRLLPRLKRDQVGRRCRR